MPTIKVSDQNKDKLDRLLAKKIGETHDPSISMDDIITLLLAEAKL